MSGSSISPRTRKVLKWGAIAFGCYMWVGIIGAIIDAPKATLTPVEVAPSSQVEARNSVPVVLVADSAKPEPEHAPPVYSAPAPVPTLPNAEPPPVEPAPVVKAEKKATGIIVYVTRTGDHYHRGGCSSLRKSRIETTLEEARQVYEPCHRCHPPR